MTTPGHQASPDTEPMLISRRALGIGGALLTLAFGAAIILGANEFSIGWGERGPEPGYVPFWIGCVIVAGSAATLVQIVRDTAAGRESAITRGQAQRALSFLLPMIGFVLLTQVLGIYVASIIYLFAVMVFQGGYSLLLSAVLSVGTAISLYLMFDKWLKVPLAKGPIEALLGVY